MTTFRVKSYVGIFECKIFTGNDGVDGLQTTFQVGRSDVTSLSSGLRVGFPLRTIQYPWTVYRSGNIIWILNLICTCTPFVNKMWNYFGFVIRSWHCTAVTIVIVPKLNQKNLKSFFPCCLVNYSQISGNKWLRTWLTKDLEWSKNIISVNIACRQETQRAILPT